MTNIKKIFKSIYFLSLRGGLPRFFLFIVALTTGADLAFGDLS
jgi:hypothetical protein